MPDKKFSPALKYSFEFSTEKKYLETISDTKKSIFVLHLYAFIFEYFSVYLVSN